MKNGKLNEAFIDQLIETHENGVLDEELFVNACENVDELFFEGELGPKFILKCMLDEKMNHYFSAQKKVKKLINKIVSKKIILIAPKYVIRTEKVTLKLFLYNGKEQETYFNKEVVTNYPEAIINESIAKHLDMTLIAKIEELYSNLKLTIKERSEFERYVAPYKKYPDNMWE